jgi:hypothetical protein
VCLDQPSDRAVLMLMGTAKSTLFTPIARIEVVQALSEDHVSALSVANRAVVMAAWGDTAWRPAGKCRHFA